MKRSTQILLIATLLAIVVLMVVFAATQPAIDGANQAAQDFFTRQAP